MLLFIIAVIGAIATWQLINFAVRAGARTTAATERTAAILTAMLPPEAQARVRHIEAQAEEDRLAADLAYRKRRAVVLWVLIIGGFLLAGQVAKAQGIYMGRDGRAHAQVIVGADGGVFPVAPTFCTPGLGPCPVVLAPPPMYGAPMYYAPPPPPAFIAGAIFGAVITNAMRRRW